MKVKLLYQGHYWCIYVHHIFLPHGEDDLKELEYFLPIIHDAKSFFGYLIEDKALNVDRIIQLILEGCDRYDDDLRVIVKEAVWEGGVDWKICNRHVGWNTVRASLINYERNKALDIAAKDKSKTIKRILRKEIWTKIT